MSQVRLASAGCVAAVMLVACAGPTRNIERGKTKELSGKWSATDARETSEAMIGQALAAGWLGAFTSEEGRKPRIRVRDIVNKTDEHIDAQVFIKNIEKAMINSGKVAVLAQEGRELEAVNRAEDYAMEGRVGEGPETGEQLGEDFVVTVAVRSIVDQVEGKKARFYKINFEISNATSGEKVWIGDHEIEKLITQRRATW